MSAEKDLFEEFTIRLASAVEGMTMEKPACSWDPLPAPPAGDALRWRQQWKSLNGAVWVIAPEADWMSAGKAVLAAAGVEESDAAEYRSTFLEMSSQGLGGLGQALTKQLKREVVPTEGRDSMDSPPPAKWAEIHVKAGENSFTVVLGLEDSFLAAVAEAAAPPPPPAAAQSSHAPQSMAVAAGAGGAGAGATPANPSKTFDLLLDVELPVSVSFGRAQIPLRDVLKLTTGSIVELNRNIVEPVEIIVNNCVIARGEVVVVDGNFGVRVQAVISRQERLRTLQ